MEQIQTLFNWSLANKEWVYGGIGVTAIIQFLNIPKIIMRFFNNKDNQPIINNNNNVTNNFNPLLLDKKSKAESNQLIHTTEERKAKAQILFIDDEASFKVVNILKKAGWVNTRLVRKVTGPDDENILRADICFIDINGVAKELFPFHEGLGLVGAIKDRHRSKKVVVYSSQHQRNAFDKLWDKADARLSKNADPYEFENLIQNFSEEIFS